MSNVREVWGYKRMTASGQLVTMGGEIAGFFCTSSTAGTLQITSGEASGGADIVSSFPVEAGVWYPLPFRCPDGAYAVLTNCAGTFGK